MTYTIEQLKVLDAAATPGPWEYDGMHNEIQTFRGDEFWLIISECRSAPDQPKLDECGDLNDGNFAFIAAARTALPELIAEVERLNHRINVTDSTATDQLIERIRKETAQQCYDMTPATADTDWVRDAIRKEFGL